MFDPYVKALENTCDRLPSTLPSVSGSVVTGNANHDTPLAGVGRSAPH